MKKSLILILTILATTLTGCSSQWSDAAKWYDSGKASNNPVDVLYFVSTEVLDEKDANGRDSYNAKLTTAELQAINAELNYAQSMFGDSLNFFSPYYHQFTMSALSLPVKDHMKYRRKASKEAVSAFRYYMRHKNNGRPFILAGFSQGGMHLVDVLRQMKPEDYERMIVAYSMGYRLSADDMKHPFVKPAQSADDRGTTVSFNSVVSTDAIWDAVNGDAATCINPLNFRTDATPATLVFEKDTLTVHTDTRHNVLVVSGPNMSSYRFPILEGLCKQGNLHHWDLLFYRDAIHSNALHRAYGSQR